MVKPIPKNYENWETVDGVMKWLAERGIVPCWDNKNRRAYFSRDTPKSATEEFIQVLGIQMKEVGFAVDCRHCQESLCLHQPLQWTLSVSKVAVQS